MQGDQIILPTRIPPKTALTFGRDHVESGDKRIAYGELVGIRLYEVNVVGGLGWTIEMRSPSDVIYAQFNGAAGSEANLGKKQCQRKL